MECNETPQNATENGQSTLSEPQLKALTALAAGRSVSDAAHEADVDRGTVHRWLANDSGFAAEVNAARLEMVERTRAGVRRLADDAIATLRELMGPGTPASVRLKVVELVLAQAASGAEDDRIGPPLADQIEAEKKLQKLQDDMDNF